MKELYGSLIIGYNFKDNEHGVLVVGKPDKGSIDIINAFQDKEASELLHKLIGKENEVWRMKNDIRRKDSFIWYC